MFINLGGGARNLMNQRSLEIPKTLALDHSYDEGMINTPSVVDRVMTSSNDGSINHDICTDHDEVENEQSVLKNVMFDNFLKIPKTPALLITVSSVRPFEGQVSEFVEPTCGCPCGSPRPCRIWSWSTTLCAPSSFLAIFADDYICTTLGQSSRSFGLNGSVFLHALDPGDG